MPASVEAAVLELLREHRAWGPRRLVYELLKRGVVPVPSETGVYRALKRAGLNRPGFSSDIDVLWVSCRLVMRIWLPSQRGLWSYATSIFSPVS
jgi:hypothetical protein